MYSFLKFLSALALLTLTSCQNPVTFNGSPLAVSSISNSGTVLYSNPSSGQNSGAQFLYQKNISNSQVGLAEVHLVSGNGFNQILQTGFDTITQECSCYYIDAKELLQKFPNIITANDYRLVFVSTAYNVESGFFSININGNVASNQVNNQNNMQVAQSGKCGAGY